MIYTIIASNGQSYDLPAKTIGVMDSLNNILKIDQTDLGLKQKYQKGYNYGYSCYRRYRLYRFAHGC